MCVLVVCVYNEGKDMILYILMEGETDVDGVSVGRLLISSFGADVGLANSLRLRLPI